MKSRRLFSALERPTGTSSGHNTVWHDYAPIFRTVNNFVWVGDDGATPAMRLGFAREPLRYEDILWAGQPVPRPRRDRRKKGACGYGALMRQLHDSVPGRVKSPTLSRTARL